jgi:septal ring factor EnvC (AmiA/AmiB activator)
MKKKVAVKIKKESKESYSKDEVLVMFESLQDSIGILAEGQQSIKDELSEFKGEMYSFRDEMYIFKKQTEDNFSAVFKYLASLEDEVAEIRADLNKNKENEKISKRWMREIEKRLAQLEKKLVAKRIRALKQKYKA